MKFIYKYFSDEIDFDSLNVLEVDDIKVLLLLRMISGKTLKVGDEKFKIVYNRAEKNSLVISESPILDQCNFKQDLTFFLNQNNVDSRIYIDDKNYITNIVHKGVCVERKYITALMPRLIPWHFNNIPKDILKEFKNILDHGDFSFFHDKYESLLKENGIWNKLMYEKIRNLYNDMRENEKNNISKQIMSYEKELQSLCNLIAKHTKDIQILKRDLYSMSLNNNDDAINSLIELFETLNDDIEIINLNDSVLSLKIRSKMSNYEFDEYENYIKNGSNSSIWLDSPKIPFEKVNKSQLKMLYKHIFETKKLSVYFIVNFKLNIITGSVSGSACKERICNGIMHPHLMGNGILCLGGNANLISQFIIRGDLQGVINQLLYSSKQISMSDLMAVDNFIQSIFSTDGIMLPNGRFVNGVQAIEYIEKNQEEFND